MWQCAIQSLCHHGEFHKLSSYIYNLLKISISVIAVDDIAPVINNCPNSQTVQAPCNVPSQTVTWIAPTATDNLGGIPTVMQTHRPGDSFPVGTTPVTYTFTDTSGNSAQCAFTVTGNWNMTLTYH